MKKIILLIVFLASCARAPLKDPNLAFHKTENLPNLVDSFSPASLQDAFKKTLTAFKSSNTIPAEFHFEGRLITKDDYRLALAAAAEEAGDLDRFHDFIRENFDFYEVYGSDAGYGDVFSTGYYEPLLKGSLRRTKEFTQPLYKLPSDMVAIDLNSFAAKKPELEWLRNGIADQASKNPVWKARLENGKVLPYYERKEIDPIGAPSPLAGRKLELAWVNPIEAFYLQIQGSGLVDFGNGKKLRVGYAGQNGYPYFPIGKALKDFLPQDQISMQRIREYLEAQTPERQQEVFNLNPSYVFFKELTGESLGYSEAEITGGRTIATDQFLFPKGLLAFFEIEQPVFADATSLEPASWDLKPRWVFDNDTGGAIRGGGRVDLYVGQGEEAARIAGVMKRHGKLWYVAPKESFLAKLKGER